MLSRCVTVRDSQGTSAIDVAIQHRFIRGVVLLRDLNCKSEVFNVSLLMEQSASLPTEFKNALLEPNKPFAFDPVRTLASVIEQNGKQSLVKRLFYSTHVDVGEFAATDYPLAQACASGDDELVHVVVDRMAVTGIILIIGRTRLLTLLPHALTKACIHIAMQASPRIFSRRSCGIAGCPVSASTIPRLLRSASSPWWSLRTGMRRGTAADVMCRAAACSGSHATR